MPTEAEKITEKIVCPSCGSPLLKSGYCPKCHRRKDGSIAEKHGKRHPVARDVNGKFKKKEAAPAPEESGHPPAPITTQDYSRPPAGSQEEYLCEGCRTPVHYLQRKCKKCGIYLDWRGSPAESDPDAVICPQCGAFCGYAEDEPAICPHCRYQG